MNTRTVIATSVAAIVLTGVLGRAQEKSRPPVIPLRVVVVLNEFDGTKKLTSLPYSMPCKATVSHETSSLRMGFRVPYKVQESFQYQDVGTDIDCRALPPDESGGYLVQLGVNYSSVYPPSTRLSPADSRSGAAMAAPVAGASSGAAPITGGFRANLTDVLLHDGQTVEAASATDPVSGHVWKVEVTLNVVK